MRHLALILLLGTAPAASAVAQAPATRVEDRIPLPEPANLPPLTQADIERMPSATSAARPSVEALVPVPEPANVPPITVGDIRPDKEVTGTTTATTTPAATPAPATTPASAATESPPALTPEEIKKLTGKDLVKAPLAASLG